MNLKKPLFGILILTCCITSKVAVSGATGSKIDTILLYEDAMLVYVYPSNGVTDPPACHGSNGDYYSFSMTRPMAKEYLSLLLAAHASKVHVILYGTGTCTDQSLSETLSYVQINNQ